MIGPREYYFLTLPVLMIIIVVIWAILHRRQSRLQYLVVALLGPLMIIQGMLLPSIPAVIFGVVLVVFYLACFVLGSMNVVISLLISPLAARIGVRYDHERKKWY